MSHDPDVLLRHIQLCLKRILDYSQGGADAFFSDPKTQDAVIRNLEIISQAVRDDGIESLDTAVPEIPWKQIAGLRNVLAHQYLGVDPRLLWNIVDRELPRLRAAVSCLLSQSQE